MNIEKTKTCRCGYKSFSIIDKINTDINIGEGTINMIVDVECDSCGFVTREEIDAIITDIK